MAKAGAETRATALFFSFSAVVLVLLARAVLLQPPDRRPGGGALLLAALDRFLDGRGLLDLATRRNMVLLCHAILLVILRDAGLLGAPARRRAAIASTASVVAFCPPVLTDAAEPESTIVVWRRPQDAHADGSGRPLVRRRRQPRRSAQQHPAAAAPALAAEHQPPLTTSEEIVLVEKAPRSYHLLDDRDRAAAVVELELPCATATGGEKNNLDRRIVVVAPGDERNASTVTSEQTEETTELADDRRIEEFIAKQWSTIRHESQQLDRSLGSQPRAIAAW